LENALFPSKMPFILQSMAAMVVIQQVSVELLPLSFASWEGRAKVSAFFDSSLQRTSEGTINAQFRGHLLHSTHPPLALENANLEGFVKVDSNGKSFTKFDNLRVWTEQQDETQQKVHESLDLLSCFIDFSQSL
jgi:hypothetical protein